MKYARSARPAASVQEEPVQETAEAAAEPEEKNAQEDLSAWHDFFMKYQDRIQLGTDTDMGEELGAHTSLELSLSALTAGPMDYYGKLFDKALDLPEDVQEKITCRNFRAFAGDAPKAL